MKRLGTTLVLVFLMSCSSDNTSSKYLRWIGDSKFNPNIDSENFELCHGESYVKQYFHFDKGLQFEGEKKAIEKHFIKNYKPVQIAQSGWIRIRFIVNCKGEIGRFRVLCSDKNYKDQKFDDRIVNQLLELTKELKGWRVLSDKEKPNDYYQYLIFKIDNGDIKQIMP